NKWRELKTGSTRLGEAVASYPEAIYRAFALPQNLLAKIPGLEGLEASPEKFKKVTGTRNPVLDYYVEESDKLSKQTDDFYKKKYGADEAGNTKRSAFEAVKEGDY